MATKKTDHDRLMADTRGLPAADRVILANKLTKTGVVTAAEVEQARRRAPRS
jgi:hypothetical protein